MKVEIFARMANNCQIVNKVSMKWQRDPFEIGDFGEMGNNCQMNDFSVIGDPSFAHRILGSPGGKHCESLQRSVWRGVVSPLKVVSLGIEYRILP